MFGAVLPRQSNQIIFHKSPLYALRRFVALQHSLASTAETELARRADGNDKSALWPAAQRLSNAEIREKNVMAQITIPFKKDLPLNLNTSSLRCQIRRHFGRCE